MSKYDKASLVMIPSAYKAEKLYSVLPENGNGDFTHDRNAGTATRVNKDGLIETVAADVPRLDYPIIDGVVQDCPALLLEPARTNLLLNSEDFSDASWTALNTSVSSNQTTSPDGSINADKLTDNATSNIHRIRDEVSLSASTNYSLSVFAKKDTLSNIQLALINTANSNTISKVFDLENGIIGEELSGGGTTVSDAKIENYGNGWYRCTIVGQLGSAPNQYQISLATKTTGNSDTLHQVTYSGDGTGSVFLYGAQLEAGYPTSYIPTSGLAVTRNADVCDSAGTSAEFNDSEGVLYAEIAALSNDGTSRQISISNGGTTERVYFGFRANSNEFILSSKDSSYLIANVSDVTNFNKYVFQYKSGNFKAFVNGFNYTLTANGGLLPTGLNILNFDGGNGTQDIYGKTKEIAYFDSALTDLELEDLTSWDSFNEMAVGQGYSIY